MISLNISITGLDTAQQMLANIAESIQDLTSAFKTTGEYLIDLFANQAFESEGAIYGMSWPALEPHYALWKSTHYPGRGMLERTGAFRHSFKALVTSRYLTVYSDPTEAPYGIFHQLGTSRMPQRMVVALPEIQQEEVTRIIHDDIISRVEAMQR